MTDVATKTERLAITFRNIARVWSVLVWLLGLILIVGTLYRPPASEQVYSPFDNLVLALLVISLVGLVIAWRWEGWGTVINIGCYLAVVPLYWLLHQEWIHLSVMVAFSPLILPGVFFGAAWALSRRSKLEDDRD